MISSQRVDQSFSAQYRSSQKQGEATMGQIRAVTVLRGVAAILVVLFHAALDVRGRGHEGTFPPFLFGASGVDVFFVLSGFVMVLSSADKDRVMPVGRFCQRRIGRIVPMYWIATLATLAHQIVANRHSSLLEDWPRHLACSLAFVPCYRAYLPMVVQGWTLEYEMAFYSLFAIALAIGRVSAIRALMIICFVAGLSTFFGLSGPGFYGSSSLLAEFSFGMAVALFCPSSLQSPAAIAAVLVGVLMICCAEFSLADPAAWRLIVWGIPAMLVVAGCSSIPNTTILTINHTLGRVWLLIGESSYVIYLFHILVFKIVGRPVLGFVSQGSIGLWAYFATISLAAICLGVGIHLIIEQPLQAWIQQPRPRIGNRSATAETSSV